jgi:hypothetical protein
MIKFDLFDNGENRTIIRAKLGALAQMMAVAITDEAITAGAVTEIPVASLACSLSVNLTKLLMLDIDTGEVYEFALDIDALVADTGLKITGYTFAADVPSGCPIFLWGVDVASILYNFINP